MIMSCKEEGFFPDPEDLRHLYQSLDNGTSELIPFWRHCPARTIFCAATKLCAFFNPCSSGYKANSAHKLSDGEAS